MVCRIIRRHSLPWVIIQESNGDPRGGYRKSALGEERLKEHTQPTANGTSPGGKQGGCVLLIKPGGGEAAGDGLAWGCKASMFVITFFNLLSRLLPTFFQRQWRWGKRNGDNALDSEYFTTAYAPSWKTKANPLRNPPRSANDIGENACSNHATGAGCSRTP